MNKLSNYEVNLHVWASKEALRQALIDKDIYLTRWSDDIFKKIELVTEESVVCLAGPSVSEIGFKDGAKRSEIYQKASSQKLSIVHPQVAIEFLLQHGDRLEVGQWFIVAMEPITDSDGDFLVFHVARRGDDGLWLIAGYGDPDYFWNASYRLLFSVAN